MAIDSTLDYTPPDTLNNLQFLDEKLNVIISSIATVVILANLGSIVSKVVGITAKDSFSYSDWSRTIIFASSDDPIKLYSWYRGRYVFRDPSWRRLPNKVRCRRLFLPFLARSILFILSLASIAITIPTSGSLSGCDDADYSLRVDTAQALDNGFFIGLCTNVPLGSRKGMAASSLSFCYSFVNGTARDPETFNQDLPADPQFFVSVMPEEAIMEVGIFNMKGESHSVVFFVQWTDIVGTAFRSDISSTIAPEEFLTLALLALADLGTTCSVRPDTVTSAGTELYRSMLDCDSDFDTFLTIRQTGIFFLNAAKWVREDETQIRFRIDQDGATPTRECPVAIEVVSPIVNLVPLGIVMILSFVLNLAVSFSISKNHGEISDAAFHLVKETIGVDCTSNVLEESVQCEFDDVLPLRKSMRGAYGHVGFLCTAGEKTVENFESDVIVHNSSFDDSPSSSRFRDRRRCIV